MSLCAVLLTSCAILSQSTPRVTGVHADTTPDLIRNAMLNMHYDLDGGLTLARGKYEFRGDPPAKWLAAELVGTGTGDLDGDGDFDGAAVVVIDGGGSGSFFYLALVENTGGSLNHAKTANLGDRLVIESLEIEGGEAKLQLLRQGPGDPQCCPSMRVIEHYSLKQGDTLIGELYPDYAGSLANLTMELAYKTLAIASSLAAPVDGERIAAALKHEPRMHIENVNVRLNAGTDSFTLTTWKPESLYSYSVSSAYTADSFIITRDRRSE